jgi:hypothetical protein
MLISSSIFILLRLILASRIASSPLNLGIWVLFTAFFISFLLRFWASSWFALLIFLIYIGGILVIFAYFVAISPHQEIRLLPIYIFSILLFISLSPLWVKYIILLPHSFIEIKITNWSPLYSLSNIIVLLILGIVLFLALILVVKIRNRTTGPLRPFNKYVLSHSAKSSLN